MALLAEHVAASASCPSLALGRTGDRMPLVGLGTWKVATAEAAALVEDAIRAGYRHIDCACDYGNEPAVGMGIRAAIEAGLCSRKDLWVTSKLWNTYHRRENVMKACKRTLEDLALEYLDLYLVHFPIPLKFVPFETRYPPEWIHDPSAANPRMELDDVSINDTWAGMEELVDQGLVRNIGVANFNVALLRHLKVAARIQPQVNQVELHPFLAQDQLLRYCADVGIALTGFSPLGAGSYVTLGMAQEEDSVLRHPAVTAIAGRLGRSAAQVVLRWAVQRGYSVVPKSSRAERLRENVNIFDFQLSEQDMAELSKLDRAKRYNDPGVFCLGMGAIVPIFG